MCECFIKNAPTDRFGFPIHCKEQNFNGLKFPKINTNKDKIVCIGCSMTRGLDHDGEDLSFSGILEKKLNGTFDVLNMGRSSFGIKNCISWYWTYSHIWTNIKKVIIQIPDYQRHNYPGIQPDIPLHHCNEYGSLFITPLMNSENWSESILREKNINIVSIEEYLFNSDIIIKKCLSIIGEFVDQLRRQKIEVFILQYLYWSPDILKTSMENYFDEIEKYCLIEKIPITDRIYKTWMKNKQMTYDEAHPNLNGHQYFADILIDLIDKKKQITKQRRGRI